MDDSFTSESESLTSSDEENAAIRPRIFRDRTDPFEYFDNVDFKERFRFNKPSVMELVHRIGQHIERFFASGAFQRVLGDTVNIHSASVCRSIQKVTHNLLRLKQDFIKMPSLEEMPSVHNTFFAISGFPKVIGAIDGTLIRLNESPGGPDPEIYRGRKGFFAINVQIVCDGNLRIRHIVARWPGSVHDATMFNDCPLPVELEQGIYGDGYLLGDNGYACKRYLLTPLLNPRTPAEIAYNNSHKTTRNTVERCIGILKNRFPCLKGIRLQMESVLKTIVCCAILHNFAKDLNDEYETEDYDNEEDDDDMVLPEVLQQGNFAMRNAIINTVFNL